MQDNTHSVATLGFNTTEQLVLGSIFGLAAKRATRFVRHLDDRPPDVYLVDADDPVAMSDLLARNPDRNIPTILVGSDDHGTEWPVLSRPLQWARVIVAFDEAVSTVTTAPAANRQTDTVPGTTSVADVMDRVLVVGTDREFLALAHDRLSQHPIRIEEADNGAAALERLVSRHYVCVIIDADSRGAEALRVCKHIKTRKAIRPTAVLIVSRESESYERVRAMMAGCDGYLTKPLRKDHLDEAITRYVPAAAPY
jgi:CheY-like chemotaxis protein